MSLQQENTMSRLEARLEYLEAKDAISGKLPHVAY